MCPTGVTCGTTSVDQKVTGGADNSVNFGVTVPAGSYGPFGLITRDVSTGPIVDANYVFGHITILSTITPSTVTVEASDTTISYGIEETISLDFTFTLSVDLWKYDVIVIGNDDDSFTVGSSPTCTSETITSVTN